jgi:hypothetical protein
VRTSALLKLLSMGLLAILIAGPAAAQSLLMRDVPRDETRFDLRFMHPHFKGGERLSALSGVYDLSFDAPVSGRLNLVGRLPVMRFTFGEDQRETGFGNVYLGVQTRAAPDDRRALSVAVGIYAPTLDRDKPELGANGWIANPYEIEGAIADCLTLRAEVAQRRTFSNGAFVGWEFAASMLFPVKDRSVFSPDVALAQPPKPTPPEDVRNNVGSHWHGAVGAGLRGQRLTLLAECATEYWVTAPGGSPNRFYPVLAVGAEYLSTWVRPTVFYMFQLDDNLSSVTNASIGVKVEVLPFGAKF